MTENISLALKSVRWASGEVFDRLHRDEEDVNDDHGADEDVEYLRSEVAGDGDLDDVVNELTETAIGRPTGQLMASLTAALCELKSAHKLLSSVLHWRASRQWRIWASFGRNDFPVHGPQRAQQAAPLHPHPTLSQRERDNHWRASRKWHVNWPLSARHYRFIGAGGTCSGGKRGWSAAYMRPRAARRLAFFSAASRSGLGDFLAMVSLLQRSKTGQREQRISRVRAASRASTSSPA